jgi:prepilin-type N-terminal cleavage/methylation domain-containing protein
MKRKGFTLVELLVVIAIIGLLASIVLVSLNSARRKARDAKRKSDLEQIVLVMELYYDTYNTYIIPGTGWTGCSCGWFNYENGTDYVLSVAHGLEASGLISKAPRDPSISSDNQTPQYMKYQCGNGYFIYARLENPSAEDLAKYQASINAGCANLDGYGMNYAAGHR